MRPKPTAQQRSAEKQERILSAMDALLREAPFDSITIANIAAHAEVSPATIYQRFSNKEATASILLALYFRRVEEWAMRPRPSGKAEIATLHEALFAVAGDAWDQIEALGYIMRPAYLYSRQRPDMVGADWARLEQMAREGFHAFLKRNAGDIPPDELERSADTLCTFFNSMVIGRLLHADDKTEGMGDERETFATTLADFAHRYLTCRS